LAETLADLNSQLKTVKAGDAKQALEKKQNAVKRSWEAAVKMKKASGSYQSQIAKDEAKDNVRAERDAVEAKTNEAKEKASGFQTQIETKRKQLTEAMEKIKTVKTAAQKK